MRKGWLAVREGNLRPIIINYFLPRAACADMRYCLIEHLTFDANLYLDFFIILKQYKAASVKYLFTFTAIIKQIITKDLLSLFVFVTK